MSASRLQTAISVIYPARCLCCGIVVDSDFGLCGDCWRDTPFIGGCQCDGCGAPLPGDADEDVLCDSCMFEPKPWAKGRAALIYEGTARKLVLALKHGDRQEIAKPAAKWMARAIRKIAPKNALIAPVPLHWTRLFKRRYNQSALLAKALSSELNLPWCPDLLLRARRTASLDGRGRAEREAMLQGAIKPHPKRRQRLIGRPVILVDDVMTSGATLAASTRACQDAGSGPVTVVTLARVEKDA